MLPDTTFQFNNLHICKYINKTQILSYHKPCDSLPHIEDSYLKFCPCLKELIPPGNLQSNAGQNNCNHLSLN
jgi:hypothetical protein